MADDPIAYGEGAHSLLERHAMTTVGVASSACHELRRSDELRPDVALVDIDLGEESSLTVAEHLHRAPPTVHVHGVFDFDVCRQEKDPRLRAALRVSRGATSDPAVESVDDSRISGHHVLVTGLAPPSATTTR